MRPTKFIATAALLLSSLATVATQAQSGASATGLSPAALKQIQDIYTLKASLTPAERKMSTNLILLSRMVQGKLPASLVQFVQLPARNAAGKFSVEVHGHKGSSLAANLSDVSVASAQPFARGNRVRANVGLTELVKLAQQPEVLALAEPSHAHTNVGSYTSQGLVAHRANNVLSSGVTGAGIKVGVLSDSAYPDRVAALIASGDLPADTVVLPNQAGPVDSTGNPTGENEGTAMMEIVHDMAPNAKLFFATAFNSEDSFAANIRALRYTYGCDIIVDDISYFDEPAFQDGEIAQAVNDVTANGALYFSSAANSGNLSSKTSGTWEGDFTTSATSPAIITTKEGRSVPLNNFGTLPYDVLTTAASNGVWLHWSDPVDNATNDYDIFVTNSAGTSLLGFGIAAQDNTGEPLEYVYTGGTLPAQSRIYVALSNGVPRALHLDTERATLSVGTSGATIGHNAGASTFTAAAVYWNAAKRANVPFTGGAANPDETFSSDGPRQVFYQPDGTPFTPGNYLFSTGGGKTLIKPDAAGADGVYTATPNFLPFFGTSAAAPTLAGIAALVKSANPTLTNTQIRNIMTGTTLDNMAAGVDRDSGYGIVSALNAVNAAKATK